MIISFLIMLSQFKYKINWVFKIVFLIYFLLVYNNINLFFLLNIFSFFLLSIIIFIINKTIPKSNLILSAISILIYSIIIDTFCYYIYPQFTTQQTLLTYIYNGIVFNYKYAIINIALIYLFKISIKALNLWKQFNIKYSKGIHV